MQPELPSLEESYPLASETNQEAAACRQALSSARVLGGLMDLEHRAVHPALNRLWTVVWKCALLDEGLTAVLAYP